MTQKVIHLYGNTKDAILSHPSLNCTSSSSLSQIVNFKRNNLRAYRVRNYAMNFCKAIYVTYEKD